MNKKKFSILFSIVLSTPFIAQESDSLSKVKESKLEEVVIQVGYGTQKKGTVTGSVIQLKSDEIIKNPSQSAMQAIQGKVAGLNITATDNPGQAPNVLLRGLSTITGDSNPLYVIDGVESGSLNGVSPSDIESINVLKDASSAAIYGNKAAYGVILITTKKGKGKMKINYEGNVGMKEVLNRVKMADAYRFSYYNNSAVGSSKYFSLDNLPYNTDWFKEITRTGITTNNAISISGSSESANYYLGASHYTEKGILKGTDYKRTNLVVKNEFKTLNSRLKINQFANLSLVGNSPKPLSAFTNAYLQAPIIPVRYPNGQYGQPFLNETTRIVDYDGIRFNTVANPVAQLDYTHEENKNTTLTASLQAEIKLIKSLTFTSRYGATLDWGKGYTFVPTRDIWQTGNPTASLSEYPVADPINTLQQRRSDSYVWNWDNFFTFNKKIDAHDFNVVLGMSRSTTRNKEVLSGTRRNVPVQKNYWYLNFSDENTAITPGQVVSNEHTTPLNAVSYFTRVEYTYKNKYLLNASFRRDGMSDFQEGKKWGNFPGVSLGWVISKEDFFDFDFINNLKLRAGYGEVGNANNIDPNYISFKPGSNYSLDNTIYQGYRIPGAIDPNLTWETTKEVNFGIDYSMLDKRLTGSIDLYNRNTDDIILQVPYSSALSPRLVFVNAGRVNNRGIEAVISWNDKIGKDIKYSLSVNGSYNKNELTEVYNSLFSNIKDAGGTNNGQYTKEVRVGQPLGAFYVFDTTGFNSNGAFTYTDQRVYAGTYIPKTTLGMNLSVSYKNFDFSTYWYAVGGNKVYNGLKAQRLQSLNVASEVLDNFWVPSNVNAVNPYPSQDTPTASTYFIENGSFLRCNNITVGYTLPKFSEFIKSIRIYATALNPFIFTDYSGFSPEIIGSPLGNGGIELDAYPTNKTFLFGVSANF